MSKRERAPDDSEVSSPAESVDIAVASPTSKTFKGAIAPPPANQLEGFKKLNVHLDKFGFSDSDEPAMYFHNYAASLVPLSGTQWQCLPSDDTVPLTEAGERVHVRKVYGAFLSVKHARENPNGNHIKCFLGGSTHYPDWVFEACAWRIVNLVKHIHIHGFSSVLVFDIAILHAMERSRNLTFAERISLICKMLEESKMLCINLLKDEKMMTTIAAPFKIIESSESNNTNNKKKAERIKAGTKALAGQDQTEEVEAQGSAEDDGVTPAQSMSTAAAAQSLLRLSSGSLLDVLNALKRTEGPKDEV